MVSITDGMRGRGALLPRPGLTRSLLAFVGFVFLVCTFLLATLLATYNHNDPSWNHAVDAMPTNLLGKSGADLADLLVQSFGAASLLLPIVLLDWSVRLITGRWLRRFWLRVLLTPSILAAASLAGLILLYVSGFVSETDADEEDEDEPPRRAAPRPTARERQERKPLLAPLVAGLMARLSRSADERPERSRGRIERERIEPVIGDAPPLRERE